MKRNSHKCEICGVGFSPVKPYARFCGDTCRSRNAQIKRQKMFNRQYNSNFELQGRIEKMTQTLERIKGADKQSELMIGELMMHLRSLRAFARAAVQKVEIEKLRKKLYRQWRK